MCYSAGCLQRDSETFTCFTRHFENKGAHDSRVFPGFVWAARISCIPPEVKRELNNSLHDSFLISHGLKMYRFLITGDTVLFSKLSFY